MNFRVYVHTSYVLVDREARTLSQVCRVVAQRRYTAAPATAISFSSQREGSTFDGASHWSLGVVAALSGVSVATASAQTKADHAKNNSQAVTLFQYDVCPWCNKVKAVLDYNGIPYRAVEVNPLMKSELKFSQGYKKVPILVTADGEQINDSNEIIRYIMSDKTPATKGWCGTSRHFASHCFCGQAPAHDSLIED